MTTSKYHHKPPDSSKTRAVDTSARIKCTSTRAKHWEQYSPNARSECYWSEGNIPTIKLWCESNTKKRISFEHDQYKS